MANSMSVPTGWFLTGTPEGASLGALPPEPSTAEHPVNSLRVLSRTNLRRVYVRHFVRRRLKEVGAVPVPSVPVGVGTLEPSDPVWVVDTPDLLVDIAVDHHRQRQ